METQGKGAVVVTGTNVGATGKQMPRKVTVPSQTWDSAADSLSTSPRPFFSFPR